MRFENGYKTSVGFATVSGTVDIDNKYGENYIAVRTRFQEHRTDVALENISSGVDFDKNSNT